MPVTGLAIRAPRLVQEVMRPMSSVVRGWPRSEPMETRVDDMTPVLWRWLVLAENWGESVCRLVAEEEAGDASGEGQGPDEGTRGCVVALL